MPRTFTMSDAHMQAFSAQQRARFVQEMMDYLQGVYPVETKALGTDKLRALVETGIDKSKSYDIVLERDVARYIEFMIAIAPDFDDSNKTLWAKPILTDRRATAPSKLDRIAEHIAFAPVHEAGAKSKQ